MNAYDLVTVDPLAVEVVFSLANSIARSICRFARSLRSSVRWILSRPPYLADHSTAG